MKKAVGAMIAFVFVVLSVFCLSACKEKTLQSIALTSLPDKTEYLTGEYLDTTGAKFSIVYSDNSVEERGLPPTYCSAIDEKTAGKKIVTFSYTYLKETRTDTFEVNYIAKTEVAKASMRWSDPADRKDILLTFELSASLEIDGINNSQGGYEGIKRDYEQVALKRRDCNTEAKHIGSDLFVFFYAEYGDNIIPLISAESEDIYIENKLRGGWLYTDDGEPWNPVGANGDSHVGGTMWDDTSYTFKLLNLSADNYPTWGAIEESGRLYADIIIIQKGRVSTYRKWLNC